MKKFTRDQAIAEFKRWTFEPTNQERQIAAYIVRDLQVERVGRPPDSQLEWARMKPNECFTNAKFMADNDPEGKTVVVHGWLPDTESGVFVRHAVIQNPTGTICVTPMIWDFGSSMPFIRDPLLSHDETLGFMHSGERFSLVGVRADPEGLIEQMQFRIRRLKMGASIAKVMDPDYGRRVM